MCHKIMCHIVHVTIFVAKKNYVFPTVCLKCTHVDGSSKKIYVLAKDYLETQAQKSIIL